MAAGGTIFNGILLSSHPILILLPYNILTYIQIAVYGTSALIVFIGVIGCLTAIFNKLICKCIVRKPEVLIHLV